MYLPATFPVKNVHITYVAYLSTCHFQATHVWDLRALLAASFFPSKGCQKKLLCYSCSNLEIYSTILADNHVGMVVLALPSLCTVMLCLVSILCCLVSVVFQLSISPQICIWNGWRRVMIHDVFCIIWILMHVVYRLFDDHEMFVTGFTTNGWNTWAMKQQRWVNLAWLLMRWLILTHLSHRDKDS